MRTQLCCPDSDVWELCKLLTPPGNGAVASVLGRVLWELTGTAGPPRRTKLGGVGCGRVGGARRLPGGFDPEVGLCCLCSWVLGGSSIGGLGGKAFQTSENPEASTPHSHASKRPETPALPGAPTLDIWRGCWGDLPASYPAQPVACPLVFRTSSPTERGLLDPP